MIWQLAPRGGRALRELFHQRLDLADYDLVNSYDILHGQIKSVTCTSHKSSTGLRRKRLVSGAVVPYKTNDILERLFENGQHKFDKLQVFV